MFFFKFTCPLYTFLLCGVLELCGFFRAELRGQINQLVFFLTRGSKNKPFRHFYAFLGAMQICIARISYDNVSIWVAGCLSQPVLYQND